MLDFSNSIFALNAIKINHTVFEYIPFQLKNNKKFITSAIKVNKGVLNYIYDREII